MHNYSLINTQKSEKKKRYKRLKCSLSKSRMGWAGVLCVSVVSAFNHHLHQGTNLECRRVSLSYSHTHTHTCTRHVSTHTHAHGMRAHTHTYTHTYTHTSIHQHNHTHLGWVLQCLVKHFLNVSGNCCLLLSIQRILNLIGNWTTLYNNEKISDNTLPVQFKST